ARQRYALRTRGGCSYKAKIPGNATYPESTAHMGTLGRDEHQLVRGVPGCSAPALRPSHPGRVLLRCAVQRVHRAGARRSQEARRFAQARLAWERLGGTSTSSSADYRGVARRRYALRTRGGCSYKAGGALLLPAGNPPAAVYPRVALEVLVQGLGGDILDLVPLLQCRVQL